MNQGSSYLRAGETNETSEAAATERRLAIVVREYLDAGAERIGVSGALERALVAYENASDDDTPLVCAVQTHLFGEADDDVDTLAALAAALAAFDAPAGGSS